MCDPVKTNISIAKDDISGKMYDITTKVMGFTDFGRCPNESDWVQILELLKEWDRLRSALAILDDIK
jgi:hypothetical protein